MPRDPRHRHWLLTWFKFDIEGGNPSIGDRFKGDTLRYMVYQVEKCPDTDRLHFQMYVELKNPITARSMAKYFPGSHVEKRMGSRTEARAYCMKEASRFNGPWELGTWEEEKQGKRSDLENIKEDIGSGMAYDQIWENNFSAMVKYHKGIDKYIALKTEKKTWTTMWSLFIGNPGTGKTTYASSGAMMGVDFDEDMYWKNHSQWWDGYIGQKCVVWDEFKGQYPYGDLMRLHDPSKVLVQVKGGTVQFMAKHLVFISNYLPDRWYDYDKLGFNSESLMRRFDFIYLFVKNRKEPYVFVDWSTFLKHYLDHGLEQGDLDDEIPGTPDPHQPVDLWDDNS